MLRRDQATPPAPEPQISVLITARNEADRIESCLHAIMAQDYPMERVEILLVDDRSDDGTADRARRLQLPNLRVLRLDEPLPGLTTRQSALDLGIRQARGEIVMIADAGGRVSYEWIRELAGHMGYRDGAVTAPVIFAGRPRFLARFQTIDSLLNYNLYTWLHRRGSGCGVFAANLALRRQAYIDIGGFEKIGFAPAPDLALGEALCRGHWSVRYLLDPAVQNLSAPNLTAVVERRSRRARSYTRLINSIYLLMIFSNWILLALGLWLGGAWLTLLLIRYLAGMFFIAASIAKYGAHRLSSIWLYEPVLSFVGAWSYIGLLTGSTWSWGGIRYQRSTHSPNGPAPSVKE